MPNIRSQVVYIDGGPQALEIVASDGRTFMLTKAQIQTFYQGTTGNAASRRAQVITFVKNGIIAALGADQITLAELDYDFDIATGSITTARIG
jgi:hypothetical protein